MKTLGISERNTKIEAKIWGLQFKMTQLATYLYRGNIKWTSYYTLLLLIIPTLPLII